MQETETYDQGTNWAHRDALDKLGWVHRRLGVGDPRNSFHFVPREDFNLPIPGLLAVITDKLTTLEGFDEATGEPWQMTLDANAPANILNQAAAAAMAEVSR